MKQVATLILLILICLSGAVPSFAAKVMLINSYHAEMDWVTEYSATMRQALKGKADIVSYDLDYKRLSEGQSYARADEAFALYLKEKPDVVVLADDFAVESLGARIVDTGTPVVFLGVNNNPRHYLGDLNLVTGVLERPLVKRSIVFIHELFDNDIKKCLILFDNGKTSNIILNTHFGTKRRVSLSKVQTDIVSAKDFVEWKQLVQDAPKNGYDIIIVGLYHALRNAEGVHVPSQDAMAWTSEHSQIPVFGIWDFAIGKGLAVGGLVNSPVPQGGEAAKMVVKILSGVKADSLAPVIAEEGRFVFSRHELKRWGLTIPDNFYNVKDDVQFVD